MYAMNSITKPTALTAKQEQLVQLVLSTGRKPYSVALDAGYATGKAGYAAWQSTKVQDRFRELVHESMSLDVASALLTRLALLDSKSDYVKLQAAQDILDRAGFKPVERKLVGFQGAINVSIDLA